MQLLGVVGPISTEGIDPACFERCAGRVDPGAGVLDKNVRVFLHNTSYAFMLGLAQQLVNCVPRFFPAHRGVVGGGPAKGMIGGLPSGCGIDA